VIKRFVLPSTWFFILSVITIISVSLFYSAWHQATRSVSFNVRNRQHQYGIFVKKRFITEIKLPSNKFKQCEIWISVYMKEQHRTIMKQDKYNLTLERSSNICCNGNATMHYECIVEPLSIDKKHWVLHKMLLWRICIADKNKISWDLM
jgi:hypothetical protein